MPEASALSPIATGSAQDPAAGEEEKTAPWIVRKLIEASAKLLENFALVRTWYLRVAKRGPAAVTWNMDASRMRTIRERDLACRTQSWQGGVTPKHSDRSSERSTMEGIKDAPFRERHTDTAQPQDRVTTSVPHAISETSRCDDTLWPWPRKRGGRVLLRLMSQAGLSSVCCLSMPGRAQAVMHPASYASLLLVISP